MMYVVDAADPFRSIRQPLQVEKWATDNDLHDCPWTKSPGSNFLGQPSRGGAQCVMCAFTVLATVL